MRGVLETGITHPARPHHRDAAVDGPIPTITVQAAAAELDLAVAMGEALRTDPDWVAPARVWAQLEDALPTLLS
jgi:hypothetical protein